MGNLAILAQQPRLVGREDELQLLEKVLDEAFSGRGGLILLSGEAGIGKTSLAEEFGERAAKKGATVLSGKCIPTATSPYLPFQEALRKFVLPERKELGLIDWVRGSKPSVKEEPHALNLARELDSGHTLYLALEFFQKICANNLVLLILDDLHWADSSSIELLHFLGRNCRNIRLMIIGTYRPEEIHAKTGGTHPLLESITAMRREQIVSELGLNRLSLVELRSLIENLIGVPPGQEILTRIDKESGGNPLFALEIIRLLTRAEAARVEGKTWKLAGQVKIDIPSTIKDLVMRRLDQLSKEERRLLEYASIIGEQFNPIVLSEALGIENLELLEVLDSLQRTSQLVVATDGAYRFGHEKIRQATYQSVSAQRRSALHLRIGSILENHNSEYTLPGELSTHFCNAGNEQKCASYSLLAGKASLEKYSFREASEYFQRAVDSAGGNTRLLDGLLEALEGLGDAARHRGIHDQSRPHYEKYLELTKDQKGKGRVLRKLAEYWSGTMKADFSKPLQLLDEAEKCGGIEQIETGRIAAARAEIALLSAKYDEFGRQSRIARRIFEETGSEGDLADVLAAEGQALLSNGRVIEALEIMKRASEICSRLGHPTKEELVAWTMGSVYLHLGIIEKALETYQTGIDVASKFGFPSRRHHWFRSLVYYTVDDFHRAMYEGQRGIEESAKFGGSVFWDALGFGLLAACQIRLDMVDEGEGLLTRSLDLAASLPSDERTGLRAWQSLVQAELYAAKKEWLLANEQFLKTIETFRRSAYVGLLLEALTRKRFGELLAGQGQIQKAREQSAEASRIFERLGNRDQLERIRKLEAVLG